MSTNVSAPPQTAKWRPLAAIDRRVLGVLVEKAKTTPDQYPMTLNGLCSGCNQKSNRFPQMDVKPEDVEDSLERLRILGAVTEVQGSGRVAKYRHVAYEWLGVEKLELAVMTELLLRGTQTEGELRGRAARMDPIPDLAALRPVLNSLRQKGLVISLTPEGRGHVVTHALYEPRELQKQRAEHSSSASSTPLGDTTYATPAPATPVSPAEAVDPSPPAAVGVHGDIDKLRDEVESLHDEVAQLRGDLESMTALARQTADELQRFKDSLGA